MYKFVSKGQTLRYLASKIKKAEIMPLLLIKASDVLGHKIKILKEIKARLDMTKLLIIRSSTKNEDVVNNSMAGHFKTVSNVPANNSQKIIEALMEVISTYDTKSSKDVILIQPMLTNISIAGVVFTADIDTLSPYYIVNYDLSGRSDGVTSGKERNCFTYIQYKNSKCKPADKKMQKLIESCREIEKLLNCLYLDIEFAFDKKGKLYIFQVRPISTNKKEFLANINLKDAIYKVYKKIKKLFAKHPNLLGDKALFGVMPDWNPAEIIGVKPKRLALSLYKEIITDRVWAYQRDNYGYRNLRSHPLMVSFLGIPFIDVRVDFNSFIPKELKEAVANKLVTYYLDKLIAMPSYHDKVEFAIVHSCYYFSLPKKLKALKKAGFSQREIKNIEVALLNLTNEIIHPQSGHYQRDLEKIEMLQNKYNTIVHSKLPVIDKIYWLIEDTKRYGTLPFAGIARAAFIAVQFLHSFVDAKIITSEEYHRFMNSLNTINKKISRDVCNLTNDRAKRNNFLELYGHLRPGTYDITSLRYDENFHNYFSKVEKKNYQKKNIFEFSGNQKECIDKVLKEIGMNIDVNGLIKFIKESIEGREYAKYVFTKPLSQVLVLLEKLGKRFGISRNDLAYLDIRTVMDLYATLDHRHVKDVLCADIKLNKEFYLYTKAVHFPNLITKADDIYRFYLSQDEPNYITLKKVVAETVLEEEISSANLKNRVVFIRAADPGYDFLFTKKIAGLVTQFGGANSHMAIRSAEMGIPAVIGAGENNFQLWTKARTVELDCANKQVRIIA